MRRAAIFSWLPAEVLGKTVVRAGEAARTVLRRSALTMASPVALAKAVSKRVDWLWAKMSFWALKRMPSRLVALEVLPERLTAPPVPMAYWLTLAPTWKVFLPARLIDIEIWSLVLKALSRSAVRPPQPVVVGLSGTLCCHWTCWSLCEKS